MKLSEKELEERWTRILKENERMRLKSQRHKEILSLFKKGQLKTVTPLWHTNQDDIDLSKQRDSLRSDLLSDGYTIIENVNIEKILDKLDPLDGQVYRDKMLYRHNFTPSGISQIIDHWQNGTKLIPPTILVKDILICELDLLELMVADGKHRTNVAYFFGATHISIFVINKQLQKVQKVLGLKV